MAKTPDKLAARLDAVVAEREKAERALMDAQDKLRGIDRQDVAYADEVAKVNELKAEIGRISTDHAELARAVSLVSGGTNHAPPAG
jgi:predicted  nucleic acid-binding Zn-ribbon protein